MKLILEKNKLNLTPELLARQAGYSYLIDRRTGDGSFVRHLGRGFYPRFHLYLEEKGNQVIFNLHLDQKQPSYSGVSAHNGEYYGEAVEREIGRLKQQLNILS